MCNVIKNFLIFRFELLCTVPAENRIYDLKIRFPSNRASVPLRSFGHLTCTFTFLLFSSIVTNLHSHKHPTITYPLGLTQYPTSQYQYLIELCSLFKPPKFRLLLRIPVTRFQETSGLFRSFNIAVLTSPMSGSSVLNSLYFSMDQSID